MKKYRLEFNEKQQLFHYDDYTRDPYTFGWRPVLNQITIEEGESFFKFINYDMKKNYNIDYLLDEAEKFWQAFGK